MVVSWRPRGVSFVVWIVKVVETDSFELLKTVERSGRKYNPMFMSSAVLKLIGPVKLKFLTTDAVIVTSDPRCTVMNVWSR